jgi:hypothetical protein
MARENKLYDGQWQWLINENNTAAKKRESNGNVA